MIFLSAYKFVIKDIYQINKHARELKADTLYDYKKDKIVTRLKLKFTFFVKTRKGTVFTLKRFKRVFFSQQYCNLFVNFTNKRRQETYD